MEPGSGADARDTCWTLIVSAAAGDERARSRFCRSYLPLVRAYLGDRWRNGPLACSVDDGVQEVMIECLRAEGPIERADPESAGGFRTFLLGVVRHVAQRLERKAVRDRLQAGASEQLLQAPDDEARLSRTFDRRWALTLVQEARALLEENAKLAGPEHRLRVELLDLRFGEDLPIRDIAARWQMEPDVVHRSYARARDEFRVCLRRVVAFHAVRSEEDLEAELRRVLAHLD